MKTLQTEQLPKTNLPTALNDFSGYIKKMYRDKFHFGQSKQELRDNADSLIEDYLVSYKNNVELSHRLTNILTEIDMLIEEVEDDKIKLEGFYPNYENDCNKKIEALNTLKNRLNSSL